MQHTTKQQLDAFPGLKDMPVLGALFRSRDFQNNETELVVVVSAYLVNPGREKRFRAADRRLRAARRYGDRFPGPYSTPGAIAPMTAERKPPPPAQTGFIVQ